MNLPSRLPPVYHLDALHGALSSLAVKHGFSSEYVMTQDPRYRQIVEIEAITHELAHALLLDVRGNDCSNRIAATISSLPDCAANDTELATLRVENRALCVFGLPFNVENFAKIAKWRGPGSPILSRITPPLNSFEELALNQLIKIVQCHTSDLHHFPPLQL